MSSPPSYERLDEPPHNQLYSPMQHGAEVKNAPQEQPGSLPPPYSPNMQGQQQQYPPQMQHQNPPQMQGPPPPNYALPQNDPNYGYNQRPAPQIINYVGATPQNQIVVLQAPVRPPNYMWFSCLNFWFCCTVVGAVAFFVSMASQSSADDGRMEDAKRQGRTAFYINIAGVVLGVIWMSVFFGLLVSGKLYTTYDPYGGY